MNLGGNLEGEQIFACVTEGEKMLIKKPGNII